MFRGAVLVFGLSFKGALGVYIGVLLVVVTVGGFDLFRGLVHGSVLVPDCQCGAQVSLGRLSLSERRSTA